MPHKHNADGHHHITKMSFEVQNWPAYEAGLRRRGSLTLNLLSQKDTQTLIVDFQGAPCWR